MSQQTSLRVGREEQVQVKWQEVFVNDWTGMVSQYETRVGSLDGLAQVSEGVGRSCGSDGPERRGEGQGDFIDEL